MLNRSFIVLLLSIVFISSCKKPVSVNIARPVVLPFLEIGSDTITEADFENAYKQGLFAPDSGQVLTPEAYLPIYTEAKIKIRQAKAEGKDTTSEYLEQIASYKYQLAKNLSIDKAIVEQIATEQYQRLTQVVRASHILVKVSENASPTDSLEAYRATLALRGNLMEGADFDKLAAQFSHDPTAKTNNGDLGYFTAFQTIYPIETAAYKLKVGEISNPVRSKSGYHIIKLTEKKSNPGLIKVAHILVKPTGSVTDAQNSKIYEAYAQLQNGASWNNVLDTYSEDLQSKRNGGTLTMFGVGQMISEIETAAFALQKPGEYSKPVKSIYGWHILKLLDKQPIESYENLLPTLKNKILTDTRKDEYDYRLMKKLKVRFKLIENNIQYNFLKPLIDSTLLNGNWDYIRGVSNDWGQFVLFTIQTKPYTALEFLNFVKTQQKVQTSDSSPTVVFRHYYENFIKESLLNYQLEALEESNPEFKAEMQEIKSGVLISQLMEENVWGKSLEDSLGQERFYNKHKEKYQFPERAWGIVIIAPDTHIVNNVKRTISEFPYKLVRKSHPVIFTEKRANLEDIHDQALTGLLIILRANPTYMVEVAGYRMPSEPEALSTQRIQNVVNYLTSKSISLERILEKDYGSFRESNNSEENRQVGFQFFSKSKEDIEKVFNQDSSGKVRIVEGYFSQKNPIMADAKWLVGVQNLRFSNGTVRYLNIEKIEPARIKTLNEARGSVINDYQKELEKNWMERLHRTFPIKVNSAELEKIKP